MSSGTDGPHEFDLNASINAGSDLTKPLLVFPSSPSRVAEADLISFRMMVFRSEKNAKQGTKARRRAESSTNIFRPRKKSMAARLLTQAHFELRL